MSIKKSFDRNLNVRYLNNNMSGNTESSSNSIKYKPMPIAALLEMLKPLKQETVSPDRSYTSANELADESDESIGKTVVKNQLAVTNNNGFFTPVVKIESKQRICASENKTTYHENDKENHDFSSSQTHPNKGITMNKTACNESSHSASELKKRSALLPHVNNAKNNRSSQKRTPELVKVHNNVQNSKISTPVVKPGIRKFTSGSGRKSQKKTQQNPLSQNRDRVRCELFTQNHAKATPSIPNQVEETPLLVQQPAVNPVPETPLNRRALPPAYVATPSYPQGVLGLNSKILFKTTSIKNKKYMFIKKLGVGGSSEVYKVLEAGTSCEYAVKCVHLGTDHELAKGYVNEVRLLSNLQDTDRVIKLYDYDYDSANQFLRLVLEVGETDLSSILKAHGAQLPPELMLHYWKEMLHAVNYIHTNGVIHADLKPANFLLVRGRLKLIDFGIASAISSDATSVVRAQATGTYSYISPEALLGGAGGGYNTNNTDGNAPIKITFQSDVWSLGCILYSMVYGRTPFGHIPNLAKLTAILDPNHRIDYPPVEQVVQSIIAVLKWCLTYNMRARPHVKDLLAINYLQPAGTPLPEPLLEKLRTLVTPEEFALLHRAQI